jgi:hypothetical protein
MKNNLESHMHDIENIEGGVEVSVGAIFLLLK